MDKRKLRPPRQWPVVAVLVVLLVVAGGLALAQKWQGAAWWIVGGAAGLAVVVSGVGPLWQRWRDQRAAGATAVRRSVRIVDTVTNASLRDLRVHTPVVGVPYLPRPTKEREVGNHLRARRPVLIVGPSMVGKTRLAAVAVEQVLSDKPLLLPDTPTALGDLDKEDITPSQHVIWLDDLQRFLTSGGVTAGLLQRLRGSNWVVATLQAHEWDRFQPTDELRPPEWDVLRLFELVVLDRDRDRPAEEDLRRAIPDDEIRERIARTGIGEYVGAAQRIRELLMLGENANPLGYALVLGAVDWSLVGFTRPVPAGLLSRLAASRLTGRRRAELDDEAKYRAALDWATREINHTVSLLEPDDGTYRVYDFALDQLAAADRTIPIATWQLAIDEAKEDELTSVGYQAMMLYDHPDIAERAWDKAATAGVTAAMNNLGVLLEKRGEIAEAERWYRQAASTGNADTMTNLGMLLQRRGEITEAERWHRQAADAGNTRAMTNLGVLLAQERGEITEAERWHRQAADAGNTDAMANLGAVLAQERDAVAEAERWFRQAADAGNTRAMTYLGVLLAEERGEITEAERWYRQAADAGHAGAMNNLGLLLEQERDEVTEAERWYRQAADASDTDAMNNLGILAQERGEITEAERWYRQAADAGNTDAMNNLGLLLAQEQNQVAEAEEWFRRAADAGSADAMTSLGVLLEQERDEVAEAERWYRQAADAGNTDAMNNLGLLAQERGEIAEAEEWFRRSSSPAAQSHE